MDIRSARISSLGTFVVDAFYLTHGNGKPLSEQSRAAVDEALRPGVGRLAEPWPDSAADHNVMELATCSTS